jgi:hypothetical protein
LSVYSWSKIEGLYLLHKPDVSVVAIGSDQFNIYYLLDGLHAKGWHLNGLQDPPGYIVDLLFFQEFMRKF